MNNETNELGRQWRLIRNRIDIMLTANNVLKTDELRRQCLVLDNMTSAERTAHILANWGPLYLEKVSPLLLQLDLLERPLSGKID
jgi:hypothetical protein